MREPEFEDIQAALSVDGNNRPGELSRRTFLKLLAAGVGVSMMPNWMQDAAYAAPSLGADDGILIVLQMGGGNDGLNTVVPTGDSSYYAKRGSLAISQSTALPIANGIGLHPSLSKLRDRFTAGKVAVVQGVGWQRNDLSHFDCIANWMSGWAPTSTPSSIQKTGWLGRYLDDLGSDPLYGISISSSTPLYLQGTRTVASTMTTSPGGLFLGGTPIAGADRRLVDALGSMASTATGWGSTADTLAKVQASGTDISARLGTCLSPPLPSGNLNSQLGLVARLINANLGTRVYGVSWGTFDTHENQAGAHAARLAEMDAAIDTFYSILAPAYSGRVTLVTFSEFGRRVKVNGSNGTDHGTASSMFVIGDAVKGGIYGAQPSLTDLDSNDNMKPAVDFHDVYSSILTGWLNADPAEILGSNFSDLGLFDASPAGTVISQPTTPVITPAPAPNTPTLPSSRPISFPRAYRIVTAAGLVKSYGGSDSYGDRPADSIAALAVTPDQRGYWLVSPNGSVYSYGNAPFHGAANTYHLNAPIVGAAATATGNGYWLLGRDGGIFSFGDAQFFGSTGGSRLNQPVVGMTATPTGKGYWFVASDGGIFCFGDAQFFGSTGSFKLNKPIVGMASTPDGNGYWLVASDGGIFCFGNAAFYGSTGSVKLNKPIVGMASTPTGKGYRLVASDGGVFTFGDATFEGSMGASNSGSPVIGIIT